MKEKISNVLQRSALRLMSKLVMILACVLSLVSCAEEARNITDDPTTLTKVYDLKTLDIQAEVEDTLQQSTVTFNQTAHCINTREGIDDKFSPFAYLDITLSKKVIEISSIDELPIKLQKSYIASKTPYKSATEIGADVVKVFEFDDSQVATAKYGYRYKIVTVNTDTLDIPHLEIDEVSYVDYKTSLYEPSIDNKETYKVTPKFKVTYSDRYTTQNQETYTVSAAPWYFKVIKENPTVVTDVSYEGKYVGCPIEAYEVKETVTTNKGNIINTYKTPLKHSFKAPAPKEQVTLDSLFNNTSTGKIQEDVFSTVTQDGFTINTITGLYTSQNKSKNGSTYVESTITYTYEVPTKLKTEYGTYTIPELNVSFEELGFEIKETARSSSEITFKTLNYVSPKLSSCVLDEITEEVTLKLAIAKDPEIVKRDSTYTLTGENDIYEVEKNIIWSDGSTTGSTYSYTGYHTISATDFGEKITTSLNWEANKLEAKETSTKEDVKNYSSTTKMVAVYTTHTHTASATNKKESGVFTYTSTTPIVTFIDGNIKKEFPARKFSITDLGAKLDSTPTEVVKNSITYNSYEYDHTISYTWNSSTPEQLTSNGLLLMQKDETSTPTYSESVTWTDNTAKVTVIKTIPHTLEDDETFEYKTSFTVSLDKLTDDKIYADNTSFSTTQTLKDNTSQTSTDGYFTIKSRTRSYDYLLSNGDKSRTMSTKLKDATITFDDGTYKKEFDISLNLTHSETFGNTFTSGDYNVTPHKLSLSATSSDNKKTLTTSGTTDIYVKKPKVTYTKSQTWNGNTTTLTVTKTLDGKSDTYTTNFTISLKDLSNGDVYASNTSFTTSKTETSNTSSPSKDGYFTINKRTISYDYIVSNNEKSRTMQTTLEDAEIKFDDGQYTATFDVRLTLSEQEKFGTTTESGNYRVTPHTLTLTAQTVDNHKLTADGITNIYVEKEPETPHLGKPKSFIVTATYDPSSKVTRRAFCFNWDDGVTYAVCDYETMLPAAEEFMYQIDTYKDYNSVAYDKQGSWVPARGSDDNDAIRWYSKSGSLIAGIDKAVSCKTIGWKNVTNGKYSLVITGYTYEINGYTITVTAPNGEKVSFDSHYSK